MRNICLFLYVFVVLFTSLVLFLLFICVLLNRNLPALKYSYVRLSGRSLCFMLTQWFAELVLAKRNISLYFFFCWSNIADCRSFEKSINLYSFQPRCQKDRLYLCHKHPLCAHFRPIYCILYCRNVILNGYDCCTLQLKLYEWNSKTLYTVNAQALYKIACCSFALIIVLHK